MNVKRRVKKGFCNRSNLVEGYFIINLQGVDYFKVKEDNEKI